MLVHLEEAHLVEAHLAEGHSREDHSVVGHLVEVHYVKDLKSENFLEEGALTVGVYFAVQSSAA